MILGTGIDIIEVERIEKAIGRWGDHFLKHVFNDEEIAYSQQFKSPAKHFAVRFAAKEAIYKAMPDGIQVSWKDLTIKNDPSGKPYCLCRHKDFKNQIHLSLSHTHTYAVASAVITT